MATRSSTAPAKTRPGYPVTRRIRFPFGADGSYGKYFVDNDRVFSHFVAGLSGSFPAGEESFIRSVRYYRDQVTDPELKKRVAGFIGQESVHGQQHRQLNDRLIEMGYRIAWWDSKTAERRRKAFESRVGPRFHLAMTAAAEHYTAVLANRILSLDEVQQIPGDTEVWHLLNWHALEELEHKSVAFDVYRLIGGSERMRISVMAAIIALMMPFTFLTLGISIAADPVARRRPLRLIREARKLFGGPIFDGILGDLTAYLRPGFHPDDIDTTALLDHWHEELFGAEGVLLDHLK